MSFRVARPTARLEEIRQFYGEVLEMDLVSSFSDHSGYSGFIFKLPGQDVELEFIYQENIKRYPKPTPENLLVWYIDNPLEWEKKIKSLEDRKVKEVQPENPWWEGRSRTFEDPDGWRIVISKKNE